MNVTTKYTTRSGSIYIVRQIDGEVGLEIQRTKLGEKHDTPERRAKRSGDGIDTLWRHCHSVECGGVGDILRIYFDRHRGDDALFTSQVTSVEVQGAN